MSFVKKSRAEAKRKSEAKPQVGISSQQFLNISFLFLGKRPRQAKSLLFLDDIKFRFSEIL